LVNHYIRSESDSRQNGPPGQIDYVTTTNYDLSGKTGVVIAFDSAYEQNQDSIVGIEYTVDGGTNWNPVFYWLQDGYNNDVPDIIRDGQGNIDVLTTLLTSYGNVARYTDPVTSQLVGGYYGFFLKAPITPALAPILKAASTMTVRSQSASNYSAYPARTTRRPLSFASSMLGLPVGTGRSTIGVFIRCPRLLLIRLARGAWLRACRAAKPGSPGQEPQMFSSNRPRVCCRQTGRTFSGH